MRRGGALPLPRATARVAPTEGYKQYRGRDDVGSELSAASGRGSEVSEWPRSKLGASAVRQRKNFGHRNRIIVPYGGLQEVRLNGASRTPPPTECNKKCGRAGRCGHRPLRKRNKKCGEVRNPPVTAAPCQPPLGKGAGTGVRIATGAKRPRNDRGVYMGCGTGMQKQVSRFTHLFLSCSFLRQFRIIGQERFVSKFCDLIRRGFEAILDVL